MVTDDVHARGGSEVPGCAKDVLVCKYFIRSREMCKVICKVGFIRLNKNFSSNDELSEELCDMNIIYSNLKIFLIPKYKQERKFKWS